MALAVDIKMLGDKELERMLTKLPDKVQKKVLRTPLRAVAKTARDEAVRRVPKKTGNLAAALKRSKIKTGKRSRDRISFVYDLPTRDLLDIPPGAKWYYPAHLEYGHGTVAARPYLRPAVDENLERFYKFMRSSMRIGIRVQALKLAKK